ncbi:MAG: hypothetical protein M3R27_00320 [Bacteroidota bacterium]|nr:hypothetical protein [Bacteroidota bacterium]
MKKRALHYLLFAAINITLLNTAQAQTAPPKNELILSIPSITSKSYEEIKQTLESIPGVELAAYCSHMQSFLIYYDTKKIDGDEYIVRQLQSVNKRYISEVKTGTSIQQIMGECSKFPATVSEVK